MYKIISTYEKYHTFCKRRKEFFFVWKIFFFRILRFYIDESWDGAADYVSGYQEWYSYCPWNDRPYQCLNCPNSYFKKAHLKRHVTSACNGKEPRYKCPYCTYMSRYSWDTYKHVKRLHENHDVFAIDMLNMSNCIPKHPDAI